ncbi:TetR/AcrR family transcriptional regulator [Frankia sp. CNm7]|uniref:TetR/AcrR family transcriptional regulator n=1 Tax=Frankia nepalensis TaxID=1836974 RepID=A0A937UUS9_9ACTN|nr:TetR/AcrR family transcriptional regulator [Frankia nepalensis]MBL7500634.1 TetR/AcrR family transcriptional regulator [Frankia nepalensis]MBL7511405.1 TetR/AcrR family transcriptional regulator [Frankia nepalensis]MBL7521762.1 TetR/AcrR family transcriptional regulator [Frankia nepalensis]MBL7631501.1 TetR/AcrR family transcriptional regulator [Frankia nepalensis]
MTTSSEDVGASWRRLEPDVRREQILECAVRLLGERPYAQVSMTEVAREAGVARGLVNHYFGTKRELYLEVVRRMVMLPYADSIGPMRGPLKRRVDHSVTWFLDTVSAYGPTFVAVTGAGGVGDDPEVEQIIDEADDLAAGKVLEAVGFAAQLDDERQRAVLRAYGGLARAAIREWIRRGTLTREDVHLLLSNALTSIVRDVLPGMSAAR